MKFPVFLLKLNTRFYSMWQSSVRSKYLVRFDLSHEKNE